MKAKYEYDLVQNNIHALNEAGAAGWRLRRKHDTYYMLMERPVPRPNPFRVRAIVSLFKKIAWRWECYQRQKEYRQRAKLAMQHRPADVWGMR